MASVMVIDDHPIDRQLLAHLLGHMRHDVIEAGSAAEALAQVTRVRPDLIICDIEMPEMDGISFARALRAQPASAQIPLIYYSASLHDDALVGTHREHNIFAVLAKPAEPETIAALVARALGAEPGPGVQLIFPSAPSGVDALALRLAALVRVGLDLSSREQDDRALLQKFCHAARDVVGACYAWTCILATAETAAESCWSGRVPAALSQRCERPGIERELAALALEGARQVWAPGTGVAGVGATLAVPLATRSGHQGWLCLFRGAGEPEFSLDDERLAVTLATQIGLAYDNALLYKASQRQNEALVALLREQRESKLALERSNQRVLEAMQEAQAMTQARLESARELRLADERNRELQGLDRLKDEFIGIVSHELRTPLNAIMGFGSVLVDGLVGELTPEQLPYAHKIEIAAERLLGLIDDLLDFGRLQAGKMRFEFGMVDLGSAIAKAVMLLQQQADQNGLSLRCELEDAPLWLWGDETRLTQVVINLVGNAIKFTPAGGTVTVRARSEGEQHLYLEVIDTGIGIAPADIPKLFQRFGQLDTSVTRAFQGTGLGLAIVKNLVEAHHGQVGLTTTPDQETCFWLRLPRRFDHQPGGEEGTAAPGQHQA